MASRSAPALALAVGLAAAGCRGKAVEKKVAGDAAPAAAAASGKQDPPPPAPPPPNPMGMLGAMLAAQSDEPGPYDEPRSSAGWDEDEPHAAILELDDPIIELEALSLFGQGGGVELRAIVERLRALGRDPKVTALVLRIGETDIDFPAAEELRAALKAFKSAGKQPRKVHCHTEAAADIVYFAMTGCDTLAVAPGGQVTVSGVAAVPIHLKGTLDRLGIEAEFLHIGAFKGAAEPLTRDRPSREMIQTLEAILDERFAALVDGIAEGRGLEPAAVRRLIDTALFPAEAAREARLVDQVALFEPWRDQVLAGAEWTVVKLKEDDPPGLARLMEMLGLAPRKRPTGPHIALVYAVGSVVDGKGGGPVGARREIAPRTLGPALRVLAGDKDVKAIVIRVDSGGGSALASEILWQTVAEAKKVKPVIVSMGGVAASGGYYIGCGATKVFASRTTLTGSIGVVGGKLVIGRALKKIGVSGFPVGRGRRALLFSSLDRWRPDEREAVRGMMQSIYDMFVARVAEGRGKQRDQVHAVAQGRVWTGRAALEHGLIDQLGGLEDAIAEARTLSKLGDDIPLEVYPPAPTLLDWLGSLGAVSAPLGQRAAVLELARLLGPREADAILRLFAQLAQLENHPVQAALFWSFL